MTTTTPPHESHRSLTVPQIGLVALFMTALITAQLTAAKIINIGLPVDLPVIGASIMLPGAAVAYALTYLASDAFAELYGQKAAHSTVNVGFATVIFTRISDVSSVRCASE